MSEWIKWDGKDDSGRNYPSKYIGEHEWVSVLTRGGQSSSGAGSTYDWSHTDCLGDILHFKIEPTVGPNNNNKLEAQNNYIKLKEVLDRAYNQAATGKGAERHAQGLPFEDQPMQQISRLIGSVDGMAYQSIKKVQESLRLPSDDRKVAELLGAINYLAGIVIYIESEK